MTVGHWLAAALIWAALVGVLLVVAERKSAVTGGAAAAGVVLLVANARAIPRAHPAPLHPGASARAETLLGASLIALAVASAFGHPGLLVGFAGLSLTSAVWLVISSR